MLSGSGELGGEVIYTAFPCYGRPHRKAARQFWVGAMRDDGPFAHLGRSGSDVGGSLLGQAFDHHWATALNMQQRGVNVTRFAMLHSDVVPDDWWLDTLLEDLDRTGADVVSALIPLKDGRGLTSTALSGSDPDGWTILKRLTMREVAGLPPVFSSSDCGYPDRFLLANTGCWVCDFTRPWRLAEHPDGSLKVHFEVRNRIIREPGGRYEVLVDPEDWGFSRAVGRLGGRMMVTKRVGLYHVGECLFPNTGAWGDLDTDLERMDL